jgi:hypothetical protein
MTRSVTLATVMYKARFVIRLRAEGREIGSSRIPIVRDGKLKYAMLLGCSVSRTRVTVGIIRRPCFSTLSHSFLCCLSLVDQLHALLVNYGALTART